MHDLIDTMTTPLMLRAVLIAVVVGALCGVVGVHVVLRRLPFFGATIAHGAFPGIVLADIAGVSLLVGGIGAAAIVTLCVFFGTRDRRFDVSTVTGIALAGTFALGVAMASARTDGSKQLSAFLVGSVLTVDRGDIVSTLLIALVVLLVLAAFHKEFVFAAFDSGGALAAGYPSVVDLAMLLLIATTVVLCVPVVGTILAVTLLVVPALTARLWTDRVGTTMAVAAALGASSGLVGLIVSAQWDVAAGGAIALAATGWFSLSLIAAPFGLRNRFRARPVAG